MNDWTLLKTLATFAAACFIAAVVLVTVYLLKLPIFERTGLAWCLFYALVAAGVGIFALIARGIWDNRS